MVLNADGYVTVTVFKELSLKISYCISIFYVSIVAIHLTLSFLITAEPSTVNLRVLIKEKLLNNDEFF